MEFKNPYFLTVERINLLQRWILVHSYLYYEKNEKSQLEQGAVCTDGSAYVNRQL